LIEFIGVVSVFAMIGAVLVPKVIREMDQAALNKEITDLNAISNAIVLQIFSSKTVPSASGMAQSVANWTRFPVSQISTNSRRYARAFLIDTNGWFGTASGTLPYSQTNTGSSAAPTGARMMVLGTVAKALPVANGAPGNTSFNDIWNTASGNKPSTWTNWAGSGQDLVIQKISLDQIFHRLVVVNRDVGSSSSPMFAIDTNSTLTVSLGGSNACSGYYLHGSVVGLCDSSGTPMQRFALNQDSSYVFEGSVWNNVISGEDSREAMAQNFAALAQNFLASQWYAGSHQGGDQQGALVAMFNFMLVYGLWANECPHFPQHNAASATQVPEYQLLDQIGANNARLDEFTGSNGLLK
jgi:hypothetical protein